MNRRAGTTEAPGYYEQPRIAVQDLVPCDARRILDVGCGAGMLGEALKKRQGASVFGVEPVPGPAADARVRLDRVWCEPIEKAIADIEDGSLDCIIAADVLEHLVDPWATLAALVSKLEAGGCIVASLPNVRHWRVVEGLLAGRWTYTHDGVLDRTHLRFFTRRSIEELFWNAGLRIEERRSFRSGGGAPPEAAGALRHSQLATTDFMEESDVLQYLVVARRPSPPLKPKRVSVVILNWSRRNETLACLASLEKLSYPNATLMVVDNGSEDDSVSTIRQRYPDLRILETGRNLGYAGGNNAGIREALENGADFVLLLNNDTLVDPAVVDRLVEAAAIVPDAAFLGAKVFYQKDPERIWQFGGRWSPRRLGFPSEGSGQLENSVDHQRITEVDYAPGCALLVRCSAAKEIGLMDEDYFLTYEEADWCLRARDRGYRTLVVPQAHVWHEVAASFGGQRSLLRIYFMERNRLLFASRRLDRRQRWRTYRDAVEKFAKDLLPSWNKKPTRGIRNRARRVLHWIRKLRTRWREDARLRVRAVAIRDFTLRRFGDCPPSVRRLNSMDQAD